MKPVFPPLKIAIHVYKYLSHKGSKNVGNIRFFPMLKDDFKLFETASSYVYLMMRLYKLQLDLLMHSSY